METHEFSIIASGLNPQAEDFEAPFFLAGCDDALICFQSGRIVIDFAREAETLDQAIASAMEAVRKAGTTVAQVAR